VTTEPSRGSRTKDWISAVVWFLLLDVVLRVTGVYTTETAAEAFLGAALALALAFAIGGQSMRRGLPAVQLAPWLPPTSGLPQPTVASREVVFDSSLVRGVVN
jgi:hypothetical protein